MNDRIASAPKTSARATDGRGPTPWPSTRAGWANASRQPSAAGGGRRAGPPEPEPGSGCRLDRVRSVLVQAGVGSDTTQPATPVPTAPLSYRRPRSYWPRSYGQSRTNLVRAVGLEPTRSSDLDFLRVLRLPVPPHPRELRRA